MEIKATDGDARKDINKIYNMISVNFPGGRSPHIGQVIELILQHLGLELDWNKPVFNEVKPHTLKRANKRVRRTAKRAGKK